ncbi:MAG: glycosyltransferase family 4 protein, partial [Gammaproteobacteria bacterium]|nr:glycosyltransferase family 4 protein [Gammaproteobacteria bacterium]
ESEGFSNAIIEYMQAGLPVVCTETGGNPEAITDGVTGRLYPVADVSALAACLEPLIRDESLRQRMGHAAQIEATRRFGIQAMLNAHLDLYQKLEAS